MKITPAPQIALVWVTCLAKRLPYTGQQPWRQVLTNVSHFSLTAKGTTWWGKSERERPSVPPSQSVRKSQTRDMATRLALSCGQFPQDTETNPICCRPERGARIAVLLGIATDEWVQVAWINVAPFCDASSDSEESSVLKTTHLHPKCLTNVPGLINCVV